MNASSDKEFVQNELRKKILALEKQIEDMRKEHGGEKERLMKQMQETVKQFEDQITQLKNDQRVKVADMQNDHSREINNLQKDHEAAMDALRKGLSSDS
jgi:ribosome-binding ATPase YchF (GTP1/OBG family)